MLPTFENQTWIIETGDVVIRKKADHGVGSLTPVENLIYCLWVADYGMCNAGDLQTAADVHATFQEEAAKFAKDLSLGFTHETFSLPTKTLELQYFDRFDRVCDEIKKIA